MKLRKKQYLICLVIGIVVCVAGCGLHKEENRAFVSKEDSKIIINVLAGQSTSDAGIEDMINEAMAEKFPEIELEWECVDWGENFSSQLQGKIASGDIPDLIVGKAQDVIPYAQSGAIEPIAIEGIEKIEDTALRSVSTDGRVYGIPYNALYQGVLYNKTIFEKYGLREPKTREELENNVAVLEQQGILPFATHFQESWNIGNMTMQFMIGEVFQKEADWGERFRAGDVSFADNPVMKNCFEQNEFLLQHTFADALRIDQYESDKRFAEGEAAMYLSGTWSLQAIDQYAKDNEGYHAEYGIFPYPNATGDASLIKETNITFMMGKNSPYKEQVEQILEELLQNEALMQEILDFTQTYPVVEGVELSYQSSIHEDVEKYEQEENIVDATAGNGQLVWTYQNELATQALKWLSGEQGLDKVLRYADENRKSSE